MCDVGMNVISDPENMQPMTAGGVVVSITRFNRNHPVAAPLFGSSIAMVNPRSISVLTQSREGPDAPKVEELASTSEGAMVGETPVPVGHPIPVMAAVEKGSIKGVITERGTTAILVVGDSIFLSNMGIDSCRELATSPASRSIGCWTRRANCLQRGVGPHPVKEYKLMS